MQSFDIVTVGDSILDTFLTIPHIDKLSHVDTKHNAICFLMGGKVLVDACDFRIGGDASNVAVGMARLGFTTALFAEWGDDEFAQKIEKGIKEEGVNIDFVKHTKDAPSTFSVAIDARGDRTIFVRHVTRKHDLSFAGLETSWMYLTSLGHKWKELYEKALRFVKIHGTKLAFSPGSLQLSEGRKNYEEILQHTYALFINKDEAEEILYGKVLDDMAKETPQSLAFRLQRLGPKIISITDGTNGSYAMGEDAQFYHHKAAVSHVVERTGAGDGYATGFLAALMKGKDITTAMQWGAAESGSVLEFIGAQPGLLTKQKLYERLDKTK